MVLQPGTQADPERTGVPNPRPSPAVLSTQKTFGQITGLDVVFLYEVANTLRRKV